MAKFDILNAIVTSANEGLVGLGLPCTTENRIKMLAAMHADLDKDGRIGEYKNRDILKLIEDEIVSLQHRTGS